jgi:hypothetical protein
MERLMAAQRRRVAGHTLPAATAMVGR